MSAPDPETADRPDAPAPTQPADPAPGAAPTTPAEPAVFRIAGLAYFGPLMMLVTALILAGTSLVYLGWTLAVPIVVAVWMRRVRTVADADGVRAIGSFGSRAFSWAELTRISFPRWGSVRAELEDSSRVRLPAVSFRDLPRLSQVSGGRIPDPYAARADADATD